MMNNSRVFADFRPISFWINKKISISNINISGILKSKFAQNRGYEIKKMLIWWMNDTNMQKIREVQRKDLFVYLYIYSNVIIVLITLVGILGLRYTLKLLLIALSIFLFVVPGVFDKFRDLSPCPYEVERVDNQQTTQDTSDNDETQVDDISYFYSPKQVICLD